MLGIDYRTRLSQALSESSSSQWVDLKTSFDYLYEAAKDFAKETKALHSTQTITTIASQANYPLNPDFLECLIKDDYGDSIIKYTDSSSNESWLEWEKFEDLTYNALSDDTAPVPSSFAVTDRSLASRITGTATSIGTHAGGEAILADTAASFASTVFAGDDIFNSTQNAVGIVLSVSDTTHLVTSLFDLDAQPSSYVSWAISDAYVIQPGPRYQLYLDPAPANSGDTISFDYLQKPTPVYSDYGIYRFATGYEEALIKYAAWLYKYRDSKPALADPLYVVYERMLRKAKSVHRGVIGANKFRVNWKKNA